MRKFLALLSLGLAFSVNAEVNVTEARAPATFKFASTGAMYMEVQNNGTETVSITAVSIPDSITREVQVHETIIEGEMAKMRQLTLPIEIAASETLSLAPRGKHIMLMGLTAPLTAEMSVPVTIEFANREAITLQVPVVEAAAKKQDDHSHHHHH